LTVLPAIVVLLRSDLLGSKGLEERLLVRLVGLLGLQTLNSHAGGRRLEVAKKQTISTKKRKEKKKKSTWRTYARWIDSSALRAAEKSAHLFINVLTACCMSL